MPSVELLAVSRALESGVMYACERTVVNKRASGGRKGRRRETRARLGRQGRE